MWLVQRGSLALGTLFVLAAPASAHNLLVEGRVAGDRLRVEAFYDDDSPAQQARITLENASGQVVAEGKTDDKGTWNCPLPSAGRYTVKAQSNGHAAKRIVMVADAWPALPGADSPSSSDQAPPNTVGSIRTAESGPLAPSRADMTGVPWRNVALGCGLIALLFGALWQIRRYAFGRRAAS